MSRALWPGTRGNETGGGPTAGRVTMYLVLEALGAILVALCGVGVGYVFSRLRHPWWLLGYAPSLVLLLAVGLARNISHIEFTWPFSWAMTGRREFIILALAATSVLSTTAPRLKLGRRARVLLVILLGLIIMRLTAPFVLPAFLQKHLAELETTFDNDGVCIQSTFYTCGPAAAVTALRRLGLAAEEGEIAVLARSNSVSGTAPDMLCMALRRRYAGEGLSCRYRPFRSLAELEHEDGALIAVIKYKFLVDHYVTVLEVAGEQIRIGDPLVGSRWLTRREFQHAWRWVAVVLKRNASAPRSSSSAGGHTKERPRPASSPFPPDSFVLSLVSFVNFVVRACITSPSSPLPRSRWLPRPRSRTSSSQGSPPAG